MDPARQENGQQDCEAVTGRTPTSTAATVVGIRGADRDDEPAHDGLTARIARAGSAFGARVGASVRDLVDVQDHGH